ncbi:hypothetical protein [Streptomyces specialis]|uniref:hypothetical protein n=1 Tax=Streptomyces specialis TaxID=498367 RepID=UPI00131E3876|nr:hypothetical protein [Streptomyces specialis]
MYLEPPHLLTAIYSHEPEMTTFQRVCEVVAGLECSLQDLVEVAPRCQQFELLSDLGGARKLRSPGLRNVRELIAGRHVGLRAVRVAYSHRDLGKVLVEYQWKKGAERHPISVSMAADVLGIPEILWSDRDRDSALAIGTWTREIFQRMISECEPHYGMIAVEKTLPTPSGLKAFDAPLSTEFFVSESLLRGRPSTVSRLEKLFADGDVKHLPNGLLLSGWAPFNPRRRSLGDPDEGARRLTSLLRDAV